MSEVPLVYDKHPDWCYRAVPFPDLEYAVQHSEEPIRNTLTTFKFLKDKPHKVKISSLMKAFYGKERARIGIPIVQAKHATPFVHVHSALSCVDDEDALKKMFPDEPLNQRPMTNKYLNVFIYKAKKGENLEGILYQKGYPPQLFKPLYREIKNNLVEVASLYAEDTNDQQFQSLLENVEAVCTKALTKVKAKYTNKRQRCD